MNETEKAFREDLKQLLLKYNASIQIIDESTDWDQCGHEIYIECNPKEDCKPFAAFNL